MDCEATHVPPAAVTSVQSGATCAFHRIAHALGRLLRPTRADLGFDPATDIAIDELPVLERALKLAAPPSVKRAPSVDNPTLAPIDLITV